MGFSLVSSNIQTPHVPPPVMIATLVSMVVQDSEMIVQPTAEIHALASVSFGASEEFILRTHSSALKLLSMLFYCHERI